jgi:hypothetical protein
MTGAPVAVLFAIAAKISAPIIAVKSLRPFPPLRDELEPEKEALGLKSDEEPARGSGLADLWVGGMNVGDGFALEGGGVYVRAFRHISPVWYPGEYLFHPDPRRPSTKSSRLGGAMSSS